MKGQRMTEIYTMGSYYDNNSVAINCDNGKQYRMRASEILKLVNGVKFKEVKKRVHTYLEVE